VIGVEDVNKKLDVEVNAALEPVDQQLNDVRSKLDAQIQRNNQLKVNIRRMKNIFPSSSVQSSSVGAMLISIKCTRG